MDIMTLTKKLKALIARTAAMSRMYTGKQPC